MLLNTKILLHQHFKIGLLLFVLLIILSIRNYSFGFIPEEKASIADIGLYSTNCGNFEVRIMPDIDLIDTYVTNIQFTIKWPQNTVELNNFSGSFDITQQGPVIQFENYNYAVFVTATATLINWTAEQEYTVLSFSRTQGANEYADFVLADDSPTYAINGVYYFEVLGLDETGIIYHHALDTYIGACGTIDGGLFTTGCADFEVRLKPHDDYLDNALTNVQFTIKWPSNTVNLIDFYSDFDVSQQGSVIVENDTNYAIFVSVTPTLIDWVAENEYTILSFSHDQSSEGKIDFLIDTTDWGIINNGVYFVELLGLDYTGIIYHNAHDTYIGRCGIVDIEVILQGGYIPIDDEMNNSINMAGNLPNTHPYNIAPWNYSGTESMTIFPDSIVDWIYVELRDKNDVSLVFDKRVGLLSQSGVVMDTNLLKGLQFPLLNDLDTFYIVVKHRNHMSVMSGTPVSLPNLGIPYDFTEVVLTQAYKHNDPLPAMLELGSAGSGIYGMIAGDINADGILRYLGVNNDRASIIQRIISESGLPYFNTIISGYFNEDITLDNDVSYLGPNNDRALILTNLIRLSGVPYLNSSYHSVVP